MCCSGLRFSTRTDNIETEMNMFENYSLVIDWKSVAPNYERREINIVD